MNFESFFLINPELNHSFNTVVYQKQQVFLITLFAHPSHPLYATPSLVTYLFCLDYIWLLSVPRIAIWVGHVCIRNRRRNTIIPVLSATLTARFTTNQLLVNFQTANEVSKDRLIGWWGWETVEVAGHGSQAAGRLLTYRTISAVDTILNLLVRYYKPASTIRKSTHGNVGPQLPCCCSHPLPTFCRLPRK